jgi:hypothetical protein
MRQAPYPGSELTIVEGTASNYQRCSSYESEGNTHRAAHCAQWKG